MTGYSSYNRMIAKMESLGIYSHDIYERSTYHEHIYDLGNDGNLEWELQKMKELDLDPNLLKDWEKFYFYSHHVNGDLSKTDVPYWKLIQGHMNFYDKDVYDYVEKKNIVLSRNPKIAQKELDEIKNKLMKDYNLDENTLLCEKSKGKLFLDIIF